MSEAGDWGKTRLAERQRVGRIEELCSDCGAAGLHRVDCLSKPRRNVPALLAAGFALGRLGPVAWDGFQDAIAGVVL